jgi:AcrR family transcriptional regulator
VALDISRPLRPPIQARSRATLDRILTAAEQLLEDRFFDELTIEQVLTLANVSVGSFYARFPTKDALLPALFERYRDNLRMFLTEREKPRFVLTTLEERVREVLTRRIRRHRKRRGLLRALAIEMQRHPEVLSPADHALIAEMNERLVRFLMGCRAEIGHPQPEQAIINGMFFVSSIYKEKILFPQDPHAATVTLSDDELIDELTRLYLAYLGAPAARPATRPPVRRGGSASRLRTRRTSPR